ncbi:MAG TPA: hypothetical protein VLT36_25115 [Candidatus Dormibacteraeota bacterium]|nr:hypothetical protein [Candidatus Dormibacteraeota bacterium]
MQLIEKLTSALSVTPTCPRCKHSIPSEDVNVATDVAFCRNCNLSHRLSSLTLGTTVDENVDVSRPPSGTWFQRMGNGVAFGATHRSLGQAFGLLFFTLFWNGIVSVFVMFALASTLQHLGIPLPHWFPSPTSRGHSIPLGMTVFLWLFLTPFIAIGLSTVAGVLSCLAGRTEVRIDGQQVSIFSGVGPVGFRKRFPASDVEDVRIEDKRWRNNDGATGRNTQIVVETKQKPFKFGSMLSAERRQFIAGALLKELVA